MIKRWHTPGPLGNAWPAWHTPCLGERTPAVQRASVLNLPAINVWSQRAHVLKAIDYSPLRDFRNGLKYPFTGLPRASMPGGPHGFSLNCTHGRVPDDFITPTPLAAWQSPAIRFMI